ncbi:hypothetical protein [Calothrix sp. NIES-2100]
MAAATVEVRARAGSTREARAGARAGSIVDSKLCKRQSIELVPL